MELMAATFLLLLIGFPIYYFSKLPEIIPTHFNALGEPDGFSKKDTIWVLPVIGFFMYFGMLITNKFPHVFNYPTVITEENAERQYRLVTKLIRTMNMLMTGGFFYIGYSTIQTALSKGAGLGTFFLVVFLTSIFGSIGFYLYFALQKKSG